MKPKDSENGPSEAHEWFGNRKSQFKTYHLPNPWSLCDLAHTFTLRKNRRTMSQFIVCCFSWHWLQNKWFLLLQQTETIDQKEKKRKKMEQNFDSTTHFYLITDVWYLYQISQVYSHFLTNHRSPFIGFYSGSKRSVPPVRYVTLLDQHTVSGIL